jgi:hypothetical protein
MSRVQRYDKRPHAKHEVDPAATSRRAERRVAFAITPTARTYRRRQVRT